MKLQWSVLEDGLKKNNPRLWADLNPPATDEKIRDFQHKVGISLPQDFITCLKRHDGQKGQAEWLFSGYEFLSIDNILLTWSAWNDLLADGDFDDRLPKANGGVENVWWSDAWIPFASNGGGKNLCLDMRPSRSGNVGQVITVYHDFPERTLIAADFSTWFANFVNTRTT